MSQRATVSAAERWSQWAKRDWVAYVGQRAADGPRKTSTAGNLLNNPLNMLIGT